MSLWLIVGGIATVAWAQNQFGGQDRADAARRLIVLGVQQAISALPPAAGQAASYEYHPDRGTFVRSTLLGPTVLYATRTVPPGTLGLRVASSYFELDDSFGPLSYSVASEDPERPLAGFTHFAVDAKARVGLMSLSASYGLADRIDVSLELPLVITRARAVQAFLTPLDELGTPAREAPIGGGVSLEHTEGLLRSGELVWRREPFENLGFRFGDGTQFGLGRVRLGLRGLVYAGPRFRAIFAPELYFLSPHEDRFAGSQSMAVLPRVIGEWSFGSSLKISSALGYDYDFEHPELRRFTTTTGIVLSHQRFSADIGVRADAFDKAIAWTPAFARGRDAEPFPPTRIVAQGPSTLGNDFVDLVAGSKVRLVDNLQLAVAVTVPVDDQGFRPELLTTLSLEATF